MSIGPQLCDRCHGHAVARIMSKFNTEMICMECKKKEKEHPSYKAADAAEIASVRSGNMNFPGVGKPADL